MAERLAKNKVIELLLHRLMSFIVWQRRPLRLQVKSADARHMRSPSIGQFHASEKR